MEIREWIVTIEDAIAEARLFQEKIPKKISSQQK